MTHFKTSAQTLRRQIRGLEPESSGTSLEENSFLVEVPHNQDIAQQLRNEIERKFTRSGSNQTYRFPRTPQRGLTKTPATVKKLQPRPLNVNFRFAIKSSLSPLAKPQRIRRLQGTADSPSSFKTPSRGVLNLRGSRSSQTRYTPVARHLKSRLRLTKVV